MTTSSAPAANAPVIAPGTLADLRQAQQLSHEVFRAMVDAMSHPGRPVDLPTAPSTVSPALLPVLAVADLPTGLALISDAASTDLVAGVHRVTGAPEAPADAAELVAVLEADRLDGRLVDRLRIGTARAPELGARLIAGVDLLLTDTETEPETETPTDTDTATETGTGAGVGAVVVSITGPGASTPRRLTIGGVDPSALRALDRRNDRYPAGIDTLFVDRHGRMVAIPRSNRIDVIDVIEQGAD